MADHHESQILHAVPRTQTACANNHRVEAADVQRLLRGCLLLAIGRHVGEPGRILCACCLHELECEADGLVGRVQHAHLISYL